MFADWNRLTMSFILRSYKTVVLIIFLLNICPLVFAKKTTFCPLSLKELLTQVDSFYPQILAARLEINKAQGNYLSAQGRFDPQLNLYTNSTPIGGYINNYGDSELIVPTLYNGLTVFGGYRNGNGDWPIYYQNFLTNSYGEYRTGLNFPLLRDRIIDEPRSDLITRRERIEMNKQELADTKIKIYHEAIYAYWRWVQAGRQMEVFKKLLDLAKQRQKAIEQQANEGEIARILVSENLQQIMQRRQLINQGKMNILQAGVDLSLYYRDDCGNPKIPQIEQLPRAIKHDKPHKVNEINTLYELMDQHPALQKIQRYQNIVSVKKKLAENNLLPYLNASAYTTKQYGTGGYPLLIPQALLAGVSFKFPIYQREAKGRLIKLNSELNQVDINRKFLFDQLNNRLTNLFISSNTYFQQLKLLKRELQYAEKVQFGEETKFYEGDSTLFLVNQREQMTTQVQLNLVQAEVNLQKNYDLIKFFIQTGTEDECTPRLNIYNSEV